jgi:uroporphyrinogen-III synthase
MTAELAGVGVLITRPAGQCEHLAGLVQERGGIAYIYPAMEIRPAPAASHWPAELPAPGRYSLIIFISRNAVRYGAGHLAQAGAPPLAAVGPSTAASLRKRGLEISILPETGFSSEALLEHPSLKDVEGKRILIIRGEGGRELLADTLSARGALVDYLEVYRRGPARPDGSLSQAIETALLGQRIHYITATSTQILEYLLQLLGPQARRLMRTAQLVTASDRVVKMAMKQGIPAAPPAKGPSDEDLLELMVQLSKTQASEHS